MDWETLYCPHRHCRGYGKPFSQGYLVKNGTSRGQPRAWCTACEASVVLSYGTAYYGLEADPVVFETAVRALAEGNALRATARIVQVDKDTVCTWLHRVACHCRTVMLYFWHDLHVSECQLDELWSFVHTKEAHLPGAKLYCDTYGDAWVWIAFAPVWRVVVAFVIGKRDQAGADLLLARVAHVTDDSIPLFTSDQLPAYRHALLHTYGEWYHPPRQGRRGAYPKPQRAATAQSAVCSGRQTAQGRMRCGGEHTGCLRNPRSGGSQFGPLACQLDRQHQFCRTGQLDTASE
jgi:IS1 family transposase